MAIVVVDNNDKDDGDDDDDDTDVVWLRAYCKSFYLAQSKKLASLILSLSFSSCQSVTCDDSCRMTVMIIIVNHMKSSVKFEKVYLLFGYEC